MNNAGTKMEQGAASVEASAKSAGAMAAIDDATITAEVKAGAGQDADLSALKINVDTVGGKVTLNGRAHDGGLQAVQETIAPGRERRDLRQQPTGRNARLSVCCSPVFGADMGSASAQGLKVVCLTRRLVQPMAALPAYLA